MEKIKNILEIEKDVKEPRYEYIEKFATISDDNKSLLLRIPQEIRKKLKLNAGDKIRFYAEFRQKKDPKLKMEIIKNVRQN